MPRTIQRGLEGGRVDPELALEALRRAVVEAPTSSVRLDACRVLGALAGRAFGASWEIAERAAFALLEVAREADAPEERAALLRAMGRGFRNGWLTPYVHARLSDEHPAVVAAAIAAAGGLGFPALEETLASGFLGEDSPRALRLAAIAALGRMGADSAAERIVPFVSGDPAEASAALTALAEIRSRAGEKVAVELLANDPPREVLLAAVRYLSEIGCPEVKPTLRRLARGEDAELRVAAGLASRALEAESMKADGRILAALTEDDRAVRGALARRLRTLPILEVLAQAELLLADDPAGVMQVVAEVRSPEVTKFLLRIAADASVDVQVRARAAGAVEADDAWERDALVALVKSAEAPEVRAAAAQTLGAFASPSYVLEHLGELASDPSPALRGALLWAIQLVARPASFADGDRKRAEAIVRGALGDEDAGVRKRAAYVAGNLDASALVPELVDLARREVERADLRLAAFVALGDIADTARFADLVHLWNREEDPDVLSAASRAIERALPEGGGGPPPSLARVQDRLKKLLASTDPKLRAAAARVAGLTGSAGSEVAALATDARPRVRERAVVALGRMRIPEHEPILVRALGDVDPVIQERAAHALLAMGAPKPVLELVTHTADRAAALRLVSKMVALPADALDAALAITSHDDETYEPLLELKLDQLEAQRPAKADPALLETAILAIFPMWKQLSKSPGFAPLAKSLRTAEMLYASGGSGAASDTDFAAPIVLWMKCLEGYMHAWLAPRFSALQRQPHALWELADRLTTSAWPTYQRWIAERWTDPVSVGALSVDVPLRSCVNAIRELADRRLKHVDSPISVTEWSRLMLFFAVDHPSGAKNLLAIHGREPDRTVRLAHRLQVLAQVRNAVTHRSVAGAATLESFRKSYYSAFEDLTALA